MAKPTYAPRALDQKFVDRLPFEGAAYLVRDTKVKGLMVAVNKASKSWKVQRDLYRGERGARQLVKTVRHTLGTVDQMKLDDARTRALEVIAMIKRKFPSKNAGIFVQCFDIKSEISRLSWFKLR
jgi:hypothetical protein